MILVIGGANIDITGYPFAEKLIRKDSNPGMVKFSLGGVGRNIAENLGLLGEEVKFLGVVGNDANGKYILHESSKAGIDVSMVKVSSEFQTSAYLCILDGNRDMDIAVCQMGITDLIDESYIESNYEKTRNADLIVLDGNLKEKQLRFIIEKYKDCKFLYDPVSTTKSMNAYNLIGKFYCIKPNKMEAEILSGIKIESDNDFVKVCDYFHQKGVEIVFITMGEDGVFYSNKIKHARIKGKDIQVKNATGAGDAFVAGLAYGIVNGFSVDKMAEFAIKCSEMAIITEETINKDLDKNLILKEIKSDKNKSN